jgi:predicted nucleic acid-binding protein
LIYLDPSVLLPLVAADAHSARATVWYLGVSAALIVSDLANLEVSAVISRSVRAGRLSPRKAESALLDFDAMRAGCERLSHTIDDFLLAGRLVRDFGTKLAPADALHLASAKNAGAVMATFDRRLAEAARAQGVDLAALV